MKKLILFLFLATFIYKLEAQVSKGDEYFNTYQFDLAKDFYEKALGALKTQEERAQVNYKLGYCYKMLGDSDKAEMYFGAAVKNYVKGVIKPDVLLFYADALRMNGKYEDAIEVYKQYLQISPNDHRATSGLESCKIVPQWLNRPTRYKVNNVARFNTANLDFSPAWATKDFRVIYFTTSREGTKGSRNNYKTGQKFTDIFEISQDRKGAWSEPIPLVGEINSEEDEGACVVSMKGSEMYFTRCKAGKTVDEPCKIFYVAKKGNAWDVPTIVTIQGFSNYEVGYPALSPDDKILYFSAEAPDGYGGMDIYMAYRINNSPNNYGRPINLGPIVNTPGDEVFPTVRHDGTLYFSSDGHKGMGGLDIYKTIRDEKGNIIGIENMKYPINSSFDDFEIIFEGKEERGYFSSNRKGGKGSDDIYSFVLPPLVITLNGMVRDTTDIDKIVMVKDAKITLLNDAGIVAELKSSETGTFKYQLEPNQNYKVKAEVNKDYFSNSVIFTTKNIEYDTVINVVINLAKIPRIIVLPNIEYDYDKATLRPQSMVALDELVKTLNDNPNLVIELRAHTDFRGNDDYNMRLSQARAQSCVDYLISKGIKPDRLVAKGFGESMPRVVTKEISKEFPFLKEGDVLTEDFIVKLKDNSKIEIAHQLNRRTEFSVLSTDYGITPEQKKAEEEKQQKQIKQGGAVIKDSDSKDF
ncbi:MAG TPA: OmpA family protein [Bacteroidales bacterium]|nr:OmpA family protein [Bacteroidales bacterium]HOL97000.1 OmpA family protein [Bacteroidales bacterium]HOM36283.1 OmpA family protein [Bacteroidales bacterium]HPD23793.1 OmpA family protein [Bacteroidales bacterium]HRS98685.1 OmpA family protein [Bacteroidales bacterium]